MVKPLVYTNFIVMLQLEPREAVDKPRSTRDCGSTLACDSGRPLQPHSAQSPDVFQQQLHQPLPCQPTLVFHQPPPGEPQALPKSTRATSPRKLKLESRVPAARASRYQLYELRDAVAPALPRTATQRQRQLRQQPSVQRTQQYPLERQLRARPRALQRQLELAAEPEQSVNRPDQQQQDEYLRALQSEQQSGEEGGRNGYLTKP